MLITHEQPNNAMELVQLTELHLTTGPSISQFHKTGGSVKGETASEAVVHRIRPFLPWQGPSSVHSNFGVSGLAEGVI